MFLYGTTTGEAIVPEGQTIVEPPDLDWWVEGWKISTSTIVMPTPCDDPSHGCDRQKWGIAAPCDEQAGCNPEVEERGNVGWF